jgi:divinyl protochlorophyllide a 8-vinyl-reductase
MNGTGAAVPSAFARIGPNAILQTLAVLERDEGPAETARVLAWAGLQPPPPTAGMLPEGECAALHRALRVTLPNRASALLRCSGLATGDYILRHRIPAPARAVIRHLPAWLGARLLSAAIARHAWTFAGSGRFAVAGHAPLTFCLHANPLIAGESAEAPLCHWHVAVFERLFSKLVWPDARVVETTCAGRGEDACRFVVLPRACESVRKK